MLLLGLQKALTLDKNHLLAWTWTFVANTWKLHSFNRKHRVMSLEIRFIVHNFFCTLYNVHTSFRTIKSIYVKYTNWLDTASHCYSKLFQHKRISTFLCYFPVFLDIHRHPKQKEFFKCYDTFLRATLTGHGHPSPLWKIVKMVLFNPCM